MSDAFYDKLVPYLREELATIRDDVTVLGHIPKTEGLSLESRHLGLKLPGEIVDIRERIARFAKIMEAGCEIDELVGLMGADEEVPAKTREEEPDHERAVKSFGENLVKTPALDEVFHESSVSCVGTGAGARFLRNCFIRELSNSNISVARDEAFCFYYPENLELLEELGAKIVYFSPIHDTKLPDGTDAILLGGGYPELYLNELSGNTSMLGSIRDAIENGVMSIAECGGFMYLHRAIEDAEGRSYEMVGVIDGACHYTGRLVNFGYTRIESVKEDVACDFREALIGMRGHEFHYYDSTANGSDAILCKPSTGRTYEGMHIAPDHIWGWPHLYYRSN